MGRLPIVAVSILLLAPGLATVLRSAATEDLAVAQVYDPGYFVPPPTWLRVMSLRHHEALADLLWVKALVYYGEELGEQGDVAFALSYADAILTLDPEFRKVYHWAGMAGMYNTSGVDEEDIRAAIVFLERGVRRFPDDGEMAWDLGASLAYELAPRVDDPEEKRRLNERGVEHMMVAARLGAGPTWLVLTNATTLRRLGRTEQAIRHLEEMYATVGDEGTREQIAVEIAALRNQSHAEAFQRAHQELEERRRAELPWVPAPLYLLLGRPAPQRQDTTPSDWGSLADR